MIFDDNNIEKLTDIELVKLWFNKNCRWDLSRYISDIRYINGKMHLSLIDNNHIFNKNRLLFLENAKAPDFIIDYCDMLVSVEAERFHMIPNICTSEVTVHINLDDLDDFVSSLSNIKSKKSIRLLSILVSTDTFSGYTVNRLSFEELEELRRILKSKFTIEFFKSFNIIIGKDIKIGLV